jgi:hypothetical protein
MKTHLKAGCTLAPVIFLIIVLSACKVNIHCVTHIFAFENSLHVLGSNDQIGPGYTFTFIDNKAEAVKQQKMI